MLVSTFELLYTRQIAQVPTVPEADVNTVSRRTLQAYFLTIANLEAQDLMFRVRVTVTAPTDPAPIYVNRVGSSLTTGIMNAGVPGTYSALITIPGRQTGLIGVFPSELGNPSLFQDPSPTRQTRGFVELSLPPVRLRPQLKGPARVLLTPDLRGTFLPNEFPGTKAGLDFDATFTTLPLASGKALNEVENERVVLNPQVPKAIDPYVPPIDIVSASMDPELGATALPGLLAAISPSAEQLEVLEGLLAAAGAGVRVVPR